MRGYHTAFLFQSTRPHGARQPLYLAKRVTHLFQSTRPYRARHHRNKDRLSQKKFQSTRPLPGATQLSRRASTLRQVSIHARPYGARPGEARSSDQSPCCFNPRARMGRDADGHQQTRGDRVSIHAPARGATSSRRTNSARYWSFNPRAPTGRDALPAIETNFTNLFQSTRPYGGRDMECRVSPPAHASFNPRARTGRDANIVVIRIQKEVSIHAPTRGATFFNPPPVRRQKFQSTRPYGARHRRRSGQAQR